LQSIALIYVAILAADPFRAAMQPGTTAKLYFRDNSS
jgi:hypothetical protein